jgi:hypothetical protein
MLTKADKVNLFHLSCVEEARLGDALYGDCAE